MASEYKWEKWERFKRIRADFHMHINANVRTVASNIWIGPLKYYVKAGTYTHDEMRGYERGGEISVIFRLRHFRQIRFLWEYGDFVRTHEMDDEK